MGQGGQRGQRKQRAQGPEGGQRHLFTLEAKPPPSNDLSTVHPPPLYGPSSGPNKQIHMYLHDVLILLY